MSGKFMKVKRIIIPTITLMVIASQLCGCAAGSSQELLSMLERQESITIEVAEPISQEQGTQNQLEWVELASLTTYPEFRDTVDDILNITAHGSNGKNGILYVDLEGNHTNNSTMYYAFSNQKFIDKAWNNSETLPKLLEATKAVYADVETDAVAKVAFLNAYFNILPDAEPNYFNGGQTLTRAEYLSAVYRAGTPVSTLETDIEFTNSVDLLGTNENTAFANQIADYSYLTIADESLNDKTFDGTISRAEAIYTIVRMYYNAEYESLTGKESSFSDIKNGGDILEKAGKKYLKENETTADAVKFGKSYELNYMLQNPDKGVTPELYKAMVVAKNHGLITGTECRWDEGLTKAEAINILSRVFEDLGTTTNADRGTSAGEIIENSDSTLGNGVIEDRTEGKVTVTGVDEDGNAIVEVDFDGNPALDPSNIKIVNGKYVYTDEYVAAIKELDKVSHLSDKGIDKLLSKAGRVLRFAKSDADVEECLGLYLYDLNGNQEYFKEQPGDIAGNTGGGNGGSQSDNNSQTSEEDFTTPENNKPSTGSESGGSGSDARPGEITVDLDANDAEAGDGGELITDITLNP